MPAERTTGYRGGEVRTKEGQLLRFTAPTDDFELAREAILNHVRTITIPSSAVVNVEHGGYGRYSRYALEQVDYGGGQNEAGGGYYEILKIGDAPDDRHPIVSHGYMASGEWFSQFFAEWETVEAAKAHWDIIGRSRIITADTIKHKYATKGSITEVPGLIRVVDTGYLTPWFYATGDTALVGDYAFPEHLSHDPTFTFGRQFLVPETSKQRYDEIIYTLKTCMGCVIEERKEHRRRNGYDELEGVKKYRAVQWHDGSITEIYPSTPSEKLPIPIAEGDTWVVDAQRKFNRLLAGGSQGFEVNFANGGKFVGKYVPAPEAPRQSPAGDYNLVVILNDGTAREGWINGFVPTVAAPNITKYVEDMFVADGKVVIRIEIVGKKRTGQAAKKWSGVYHSSLQAKPREILGL